MQNAFPLDPEVWHSTYNFNTRLKSSTVKWQRKLQLYPEINNVYIDNTRKKIKYYITTYYFLIKTQNFSPSCKSIHKNLYFFLHKYKYKTKVSLKNEKKKKQKL